MIRARGKGRFWSYFSSFVTILLSISIVVWSVIFNDQFVYYPMLGFLFISFASLLFLGFLYGAKRNHKIRQSGKRCNPSLHYKSLMGLVFILFILQFPIGIESYQRWRSSVNFPSEYDTNIGDQFVPESSGTIYSSIPDAPSAHCSSIIYLPNGSLFAVWFAGTGEKHPDVAIYGSFCEPNVTGGSLDLTWSTPRVIADTLDQSEGNPCLYLAPNGRLHLFYQTIRPRAPLFPNGWGPILEPGWSLATIKWKHSDDNGLTWSDPIFLREAYFWIIRTPPLLTQNGNVILPYHRELMQYQSGFYICDDPNLEGSWSTCARIRTPSGCLEPAIIQLDNGRILCLMRTTDDRIYKSFSDDSGFSWKKAYPMRFPNPNSQVSLLKISDGRVVLLCNPSTNGRGTFSIILGDENGEYWSDPNYIKYNPGAEYSYPCMLELPDKTIVYTYTHLRQTIGWGRFNITQLDGLEILRDI